MIRWKLRRTSRPHEPQILAPAARIASAAQPILPIMTIGETLPVVVVASVGTCAWGLAAESWRSSCARQPAPAQPVVSIGCRRLLPTPIAATSNPPSIGRWSKTAESEIPFRFARYRWRSFTYRSISSRKDTAARIADISSIMSSQWLPPRLPLKPRPRRSPRGNQDRRRTERLLPTAPRPVQSMPPKRAGRTASRISFAIALGAGQRAQRRCAARATRSTCQHELPLVFCGRSCRPARRNCTLVGVTFSF
jgi:hypothetical protein